VLGLAVGPEKGLLVSAGADETIKMW